MVKDDWPPHDQTVSHLRFIKFRFSLHLVKDDWPPHDQTVSHLRFIKFRFSLHLVKDDWPPNDQTVSHLKFIKFRFRQDMVKDDWPLHDQTVSHLKFESSYIACTWWKMTDPSRVWLPNISPKILNLRFSLHMLKDDLPPWTTQYLT